MFDSIIVVDDSTCHFRVLVEPGWKPKKRVKGHKSNLEVTLNGWQSMTMILTKKNN